MNYNRLYFPEGTHWYHNEGWYKLELSITLEKDNQFLIADKYRSQRGIREPKQMNFIYQIELAYNGLYLKLF